MRQRLQRPRHGSHIAPAANESASDRRRRWFPPKPAHRPPRRHTGRVRRGAPEGRSHDGHPAENPHINRDGQQQAGGGAAGPGPLRPADEGGQRSNARANRRRHVGPPGERSPLECPSGGRERTQPGDLEKCEDEQLGRQQVKAHCRPVRPLEPLFDQAVSKTDRREQVEQDEVGDDRPEKLRRAGTEESIEHEDGGRPRGERHQERPDDQLRHSGHLTRQGAGPQPPERQRPAYGWRRRLQPVVPGRLEPASSPLLR